MRGFQSIIHQGWFHAKTGNINNPYPRFVKNGRKVNEEFQTSAFGEYERGVRLFSENKSWKEEHTVKAAQDT